MEREEERKITIKMIPDLTNIPKWKDRGHNMMSKHSGDFETYLSQHYGVDGFPLDWVVQPNLPAITWGSVMTPQAQSEGKKPDFFCFQETDYICRNFTHIVARNDAVHLVCNDPRVHAEWEKGSCLSRRSNTVHRDDAMFFSWHESLLLTPSRRSTLPQRRVRLCRAVGKRILIQGSVCWSQHGPPRL